MNESVALTAGLPPTGKVFSRSRAAQRYAVGIVQTETGSVANPTRHSTGKGVSECEYCHADISQLGTSATRCSSSRCLYKHQLAIRYGEHIRHDGWCVECGQGFSVRGWRSERCLDPDCWDSDPYVLLDRWVSSLSVRETAVLHYRVAVKPEHRESWGKIASWYGLSGERARQIGQGVEAQLCRFLNSAPGMPALRLVNTAAKRIGMAAPLLTVETVVPTVENPRLGYARQLVLNLAGPYYDTTIGWVKKNNGSFREITSDLLALGDHYGVVRCDTAVTVLAEWGFPKSRAAEFLEASPTFRVLGDGRMVNWKAGVVRKIVFALSEIGEPSTVERLCDYVDWRGDPKNVKDRLSVGGSAHRVGVDRWALTSWGIPKYDGIAASMACEIANSGGSISIAELIKRLNERYGVKSTSVRSYLEAAMFIVNNKQVRLRGEREAFAYGEGLVRKAGGVFDLDNGRVGLFVKVDRNVLRGSGRALPLAVGKLFGLQPGESRTFAGPMGEAVVNFDPAAVRSISIGSTRVMAEQLGAEQGDWMSMLFDTENGTLGATATRLSLHSIGWSLTERLTGVPAEKRAAGLAHAVHVTPSELASTLRLRGDIPLLYALPPLDV